MDPFAAASVRAALQKDFADHIALDQVIVREHRRRRDGLSDALRLHLRPASPRAASWRPVAVADPAASESCPI